LCGVLFECEEASIRAASWVTKVVAVASVNDALEDALVPAVEEVGVVAVAGGVAV